jgi:dipeptidase
MDVYTDYAMGYDLLNRMPLWVKPTEKISPKQVFDLMRDHYEGTPMDMRRDIGAGGHSLPYRWRPMDWTVEDNAPADAPHYLNERATATQQTGFWFVGQARNWVPDALVGILWFGTDDTATSPLTPIYTSSTEVPWCFSTENGSMMEYSDSSMFWLTNRIANFAYLRYDAISADVRKVLDKWENTRLAEIARIDDAATALYAKKSEKAKKYLTEYSVETAQQLFADWQKLDQYLLVKYIDGNVKKENPDGTFMDNGNDANIPEMPDFPGYDTRWRKNVADSDDGTLRVR